AIETTIQAAVDVANTSYSNSGIDAHMSLVHTVLGNHDDSGSSSTDLAWVATEPDVAIARATHYADLVGLTTGGLESGACGRAYVQRAVSPTFVNSAFM